MGDPLFDSALAEAGWLRRLARSLVRDTHRADDAVQETLATTLGERGRRSPRAWLAKVLRNELRQDSRARSRRAFHEQRAARGGSAPSAHEVNERLELQRRLLAAVSALEEPYRATLVARFFDELPPRAIARRDGVPVRTVNTRLERGLAKLRARLDGEYGGGRTEWLQALAPFAGGGAGLPWSALGKGASMGTKAKLAAAGVLALIGVAWFEGERLATSTRVPDGVSAAHVAQRDRVVAGDDASARVADTLAPAELAEPPRIALEPAQRAGASANDHAGPSQLTTLLVRVSKRRAGMPPEHADVLVTDASPVGAAASALFEGRTDALARGKTDAAGDARLSVPAGKPLWISVDPGRWDQPPKGAPDRVLEMLQRTTVRIEPLEPGEERRVAIEIEHGSDRVFEGRVVAADDGRALAGASIRPTVSFGVPLETGADGAFEVPYSSWDPPPFLSVSHAGFTPQLLQPQWIDQVTGRPFVVALERNAVVVARIDVHGSDGLELTSRADAGEDVLRSRAELDATGACELSVPVHVPVSIELRARTGALVWRDPNPWTLEPSERRELVLSLGSGTFVYGSLLDAAGTPLADELVLALPAEKENEGEKTTGIEGKHRYVGRDDKNALLVRTAADGRFEFTDLPAGAWWIGPACELRASGKTEQDPNGLAPDCVGVELLPGVPSRRVDLVAYRDLWIRGRVEGEDGRALPNVVVYLGRSGQSELSQGSDHEGRFALGPLAPGPHELRAFGPDGVVGWIEPMLVEAGANDVVLVIPTRNSIGGRVVDREGHAVDARVHLLQRNSSLGQGTSSRQPGAFLFIALEPGTYSVQAEVPDGRVAVRSVELRDGQRVDDVVLTLDDGVRIGVRHDLTENVRCAIWAGDALAADSTVHVGEENFETVPAGPLRVELYSGAGTLAVRSLQGEPGRVARVEFVLAR